jgi:thiol-disulfide isomerase/thioredoxin
VRLSHLQGGIAIALAMSGSVVDAQNVGVGTRAPEIDLPTLGAGRVKLSGLRGHPVIVTFWGTYCPPCREEFPELVKAQATHAHAGLFVLGVNGYDQEFSTKDVQKFVTEFSVPFTIALDTRGKARDKYLVRGLPTTLFIDTGGVIRGIHRGPISRLLLDSGIAKILVRQ